MMTLLNIPNCINISSISRATGMCKLKIDTPPCHNYCSQHRWWLLVFIEAIENQRNSQLLEVMMPLINRSHAGCCLFHIKFQAPKARVAFPIWPQVTWEW